MIPKTDLDYVEHYAAKLKENADFFKQQKLIIESQLHSSTMLFKGMFGKGKQFKINARKYLKNTDRI